MSADRGLLDTSTVILLGRVSDAGSLPDDCVISAVTLAEGEQWQLMHSVAVDPVQT